MWNAITDNSMPGFWPPRPNRFWNVALEPFRRWYLGRYYGIAEVLIEGQEAVGQPAPGDALLIAPNHSHDSDPHVMMEVARRLGRQFYFMAAWQLFRMHRGWDGFVLQRMGAFSVDREGCDRRAIQQAVELLTSGKSLVVFPEGEVYRLNDRLTPLLDGVAFMALSAQRDLQRRSGGGRVWIVPTAIRYQYVEDIGDKLAEAMDRLETRLHATPPPRYQTTPLADRIVRYGELMLTIKEKEKLGFSREREGDLPARVAHLTEDLLARHELTWLQKSPSADTIPLRIKALRRRLLEVRADDTSDQDARRWAEAALADVQLALQLYSYPGNYISQRPSIERMAETVEKFEEDIEGASRPKGNRRARVVFGEPIDLSAVAGEGRPRHGPARSGHLRADEPRAIGRQRGRADSLKSGSKLFGR
jgi:hypothetical protein